MERKQIGTCDGSHCSDSWLLLAASMATLGLARRDRFEAWWLSWIGQTVMASRPVGSYRLRARAVIGPLMSPRAKCRMSKLNIQNQIRTDRKNALFHAISATSRNSLKLHGTDRTLHHASHGIFPLLDLFRTFGKPTESGSSQGVFPSVSMSYMRYSPPDFATLKLGRCPSKSPTSRIVGREVDIGLFGCDL